MGDQMSVKSNALRGFFLCGFAAVLTACSQLPLLIQPAPKALGMPRSAGIVWDTRQSAPWGNVHSLEWSKDNQSILAGSDFATIVWDSQSGVLQKRFNNIPGQSYWNPENTLIANSQDNGYTASVLDFATALTTSISAPEYAYSLQIQDWSPDGKKLIGTNGNAAYSTGQVYVWDAENSFAGIKIYDSQTTSAVSTVQWSPNGSKIVLVSGSELKILSGTTYGLQKTISNLSNAYLSHPKFSPDSSKIAMYASNGEFRIFDIASEAVQTISQPTQVNGLSWSPDGTKFASVDTTHKLTIWDLATGLSTMILQNPNADLSRQSYDAQVAWSSDGTKVVSNDNDLVQIWDATTGQLIRVIKYVDSTPHSSNAYGLALSPSGNYVASASRDQKVIIRNSSNGEAIDRFSAHDDSVYSITWKPDESQFATASKDGTIKIWTPKTITEPAKLERVLSGHTYTVRSLAWNPNGSSLASASWDGTVKLWNPETGFETATLSDHTDFVNAVAWNKDGTKLASASSDKTIKLWNSDGTPINTLSGHTDSVLAVAWSPDGTKIASGGADKTVRIWDSSTGQLLQTIEGSLGAVRAVVWTQDGTGVISGGSDQKVRGWIVATGEEKFKFNPDFNTVFSLALNKDGQSIIVGSASGSVSNWKLGY
jgi:WD40 repeat protein